MAKIYPMDEKIRLAVDDLEIAITPLSLSQKAEITDIAGSQLDAKSLMLASAKAVQYALKDIKGLKKPNGNEYRLKLDERGYVDESAIDDLFNIKVSDKLSAVCLSLLNNIPDEFYDVATGQKLEGVEFITEEKPSRKKK